MTTVFKIDKCTNLCICKVYSVLFSLVIVNGEFVLSSFMNYYFAFHAAVSNEPVICVQIFQ